MLCKIGEVEVWRILEINGPFLTPEELFPTAGPDVRRIVEEHVEGGVCVRSGRLILPVQGFLLKTPSHTILVDSCVGNDKTVPGTPDWHKRSDTRFMAALTAAGVGTDDIDYVLCTHLHPDHVGWNTRLEDGRWVPTFPNARYLLPAADEDVQRARHADLYVESVLPVIEAGQAELVEAGHMLGDHVTLVPTPGHTHGHVSVKVKSGNHEALITGDAMHSTVQCRYPDWHFIYDADAEMAVASRRRLLEQASETGCVVLGSHFALPSFGHVRSDRDAFLWEDRLWRKS
ncbi:MBL fold metallo-hydrolase [Hoeflea prorocentri]|uniref:MBL fold metallo-hydrolase n=1 Tax=Hoeflea prorocentri TaxID=1922333 RepID=A0A9X3UM37_9HYPH|nr:MBL fold metallo-hydrolase [Hoeflea prorocentri]MCY6383350.1 MBL fold metallo-hydrolase [Hoeflea prorocentri]MDA5401150.1 MBL fold metallo-hydrolase [Hoeflea prorocentri]